MPRSSRRRVFELPPESEPESAERLAAAEEDRQIREALRLSAQQAALEADPDEIDWQPEPAPLCTPPRAQLPSTSTTVEFQRRHRRRNNSALELPPEQPVFDEEERQLREALERSTLDAQREEEVRKREEARKRDAELAARDASRRAAAESEARRVAAEVLERRQAQRRQLDESRRIAAIEAFVTRASVALNEYAGIAQLRRAALTIGVAAAAALLEQTLLLEAAGGMLKNDGSGERRTAGGVFLGVLLRDNISKEAYKHIQAARTKRNSRKLQCGAVFISGVPAAFSSEAVVQLMRDHFGAVHVQKGDTKLKLRAAPDGLLCGRVHFVEPSVRAAAVAQGCITGHFSATPAPDVAMHSDSGSWRLTIDNRSPNRTQELKSDEPWCSEAVRAQLVAEEEPEEEEPEEWCPDDFICPITLERLVDPVTAADGLTYEREALQGWMDKHAADQTVLSPATGAPLVHRELVSNTEILERLASVGRLASWLE